MSIDTEIDYLQDDHKKSAAGFTMVEISVVLLILGLLSYFSSTLFLTYFKKLTLQETESKITEIVAAINEFVEINGRYPCVAQPFLLTNNANFGFEIGADGVNDCTTAPNANGTLQNGGVRIGAVPIRTIGLPDDYSYDAWGNRFTYAVTENLATIANFDRNGGVITVIDSGGNASVSPPPGNTSHYVVISHGEDGSGAIPAEAVARSACPGAGQLDGENCDNDATFRSTILRSYNNGVNYFDDYIHVQSLSRQGNWYPEGSVVPFNRNTCPVGWLPFNALIGRTIIGTGNYTANEGPAPTWFVNENFNLGDAGGFSDFGLIESEEVVETDVLIYFDADPTVATVNEVDNALIDPANPDVHDNRDPYVALLYCCRDMGGGICP